MAAGEPFMCGLTCGCPMGDAGRVCQYPGAPNYQPEPSPPLSERINELLHGEPEPSLKREDHTYASDTFTLIARVMRRDTQGRERVHTFTTVNGVGIDEARARCAEAGTVGVFDDLMYYPPSKVLTVRLSREA
jgi:hypothetical protein